MKILSWNVNGIRSIVKKGFLEWVKTEDPDILCLQETKAWPEQLDKKITHPRGYQTFWNHPLRKGYAGVSVFTKEDPVNVFLDLGSDVLDTEGRVLILEYKKFFLINVYFPNGRRSRERLKYKLDFYQEFLIYLNKLKGKNVIFCGDVNTAHKPIDLARPKQNEIYSGFLPEERSWLDKFAEQGFVDSFRFFCKDSDQYTWWDYKSRARERNVGWRIDYFFVSDNFMPEVKNAFILQDIEGSDHCPIGVEIK